MRRARHTFPCARVANREKIACHAGLGRSIILRSARWFGACWFGRAVTAWRAGAIKILGGGVINGDTWDVIVLGSGIAGLASALAAHENGLRTILIEKAPLLGGVTTNSYGLIWVGVNHLAEAAGYADTRDEVVDYMRYIGGGRISDEKMLAYVDRAPSARDFLGRSDR